MRSDRTRRDDLIAGGVALLLLIDLLELPWYTKGGGTVSGITLPSISDTATGSPGALFGVLAVLAVLAILCDLVFLFLSPDTNLPAINGNRSFTRFVLAVVAAGLLALKFILNLTDFGNLGIGFWLAVPLTAGLVWATMQARREEPSREQREAEAAEASDDGASHNAGGEAEGHPDDGEAERHPDDGGAERHPDDGEAEQSAEERPAEAAEATGPPRS